MDLATLTCEQLRRLIADPKNAHVQPALERRLAEFDPEQRQKNAGAFPGSSAAAAAVAEPKRVAKRRGAPDQTEQRYARVRMEPALARGDFAHFEYEAITFHVHEVAKYTPDWVVRLYDGGAWVIEVRMHMWEKDRIRFPAHAKARQWCTLPDLTPPGGETRRGAGDAGPSGSGCIPGRT